MVEASVFSGCLTSLRLQVVFFFTHYYENYYFLFLKEILDYLVVFWNDKFFRLKNSNFEKVLLCNKFVRFSK